MKSYKDIKLTKDKIVIVDDEDYLFLMQWKWHYGGNGYAVREQHLGIFNGKKLRKTVLMHRVIINAPVGIDVDHINRDKLDNRRSNLRPATRSQNRANTGPRKKTNTELPTGVTYNPSHGSKQPYMARVCKHSKSYFLGNFYNLEDAHKAYLAKKKELFGEFA